MPITAKGGLALLLLSLAVLLAACEPSTPYCDQVNGTNVTCIPRPVCENTTVIINSTCPPPQNVTCPSCNVTCPINQTVGITFAPDHCFTAANGTMTLCISSTNSTEDAFNVEAIYNATNGTGRV